MTAVVKSKIPPEQRGIQFDIHVGNLVRATSENLEAHCQMNKFPHASNLILSGEYSAMHLARMMQTTFIPRPDGEIFYPWLERKLQGQVARSMAYFDSGADLDNFLGKVTQTGHQLELIKKRISVIAPEPETIISGTGDYSKDIDTVYFMASPQLNHLNLSQMYMNCFDDGEMRKTHMQFVIFLY